MVKEIVTIRETTKIGYFKLINLSFCHKIYWGSCSRADSVIYQRSTLLLIKYYQEGRLYRGTIAHFPIESMMVGYTHLNASFCTRLCDCISTFATNIFIKAGGRHSAIIYSSVQ